MIVTQDNLKWLKTDLHTCGLDLERLSHLSARLGELVDIELEVTQRTRGENTNIFINRRIDAEAA